jgi:hypothetical protein
VETDDEDRDDDAQCYVCDKFFSNDKHGERGFNAQNAESGAVQFAVETTPLVTAVSVTFG